MTTPSDPATDGAPAPPATTPRDPVAGPDRAAETRRRPWAWIAACAVLALALVGATIWALSVQSDLNDQRDQTTAAQQQADKLSSQMDQLTKDVNDALAQAGQAGAAARESLQGAL